MNIFVDNQMLMNNPQSGVRGHFLLFRGPWPFILRLPHCRAVWGASAWGTRACGVLGHPGAVGLRGGRPGPSWGVGSWPGVRGRSARCQELMQRGGGWFLCYFENVFVEKNSFQCQIISLVFHFRRVRWQMTTCWSGQQTVARTLSPRVLCVLHATNFRGEMAGTLFNVPRFPSGRGIRLRENSTYRK